MDKEETCAPSGLAGAKEAALELRIAMLELAAELTLIWSCGLLKMAEEMNAQIKPKPRKRLRRAA